MAVEFNQKQAILRRWFESFNTGDLGQMKAIAQELSSPDYLLHDPNYQKPAVTLVEFFESFTPFMRSITNPKVDIHDMLFDGDKTATRVTYTWTDVETRQAKQGVGIFIHRFENGKIAEEWQVMVTVAN